MVGMEEARDRAEDVAAAGVRDEQDGNGCVAQRIAAIHAFERHHAWGGRGESGTVMGVPGEDDEEKIGNGLAMRRITAIHTFERYHAWGGREGRWQRSWRVNRRGGWLKMGRQVELGRSPSNIQHVLR
jgi:hypothetical protein